MSQATRRPDRADCGPPRPKRAPSAQEGAQPQGDAKVVAQAQTAVTHAQAREARSTRREAQPSGKPLTQPSARRRRMARSLQKRRHPLRRRERAPTSRICKPRRPRSLPASFARSQTPIVTASMGWSVKSPCRSSATNWRRVARRWKMSGSAGISQGCPPPKPAQRSAPAASSPRSQASTTS